MKSGYGKKPHFSFAPSKVVFYGTVIFGLETPQGTLHGKRERMEGQEGHARTPNPFADSQGSVG